MKWYIYPLIIGLVGLFLGRKYLQGFIINFINKKKKIDPVDKDLVFVPVLSSRTFTFNIEIKELGQGKASIKVIPSKDIATID